jgi:glycosyltransferase involved in cell wall biosynthesis
MQERLAMKSVLLDERKELDAIAIPAGPDRPFRVLYFDHTAMLGGGEIALLNLIRYIDRRQVSPIVVLCSDGPLAGKLRDLCEVHVLPLGENIRKTKKDSIGWRSLLKLRDIVAVIQYSVKLSRFIVKHDIDLIHTNSLKADIIGGFAGRFARRPVVWHVRDRIETDYLPRMAVQAFRLLCGLVPTFVIANSDATLKTLRLKRGQSNASIPSGVESARTSGVIHDSTVVAAGPPKSQKSENQVVGLIGRICPWKGQHIFLRAVASVRLRFPRARFKIVGAALFGEDDYERSIRKLCADLGLEDVVEFCGFCPNVSEVISGLDVLVHASTTGEPFGQVIIEGMAGGKPVVATNGGGVPEIVVDNVTGFLVPMGVAAAMAEAICKILADPIMARKMGLRGFKRARELFTIEGTANKVEAVYRHLLETPGLAHAK